MASNMTKYAIANVSMCSSARMDCWIRVGRKGIVAAVIGVVVASAEQWVASFSSGGSGVAVVVVVVANLLKVDFCGVQPRPPPSVMLCLNCCRM